jgi:hypothetical protein
MALILAAGADPAQAVSPPTAYTGEPALVTFSSATLKGSAFPGGQPTSYYFQYGPTAAYGAQTPPAPAGAGSQTVHVTAPVGGLAAGATYHCRLVVVNPSRTVAGQDRTFTTRRIPLTFTVSAAPTPDLFATPFSAEGTLSGTGSAAHMVVLQGNPFPYRSGFRNMTDPLLTDAAGEFVFALPGLLRSTELRVSTLDTPPTWSRVIAEPVAVRVALHAHATGRRGFARLYGTVTPEPIRALVRFQLLRPGGTLVTVGSTVLTGATRMGSRFGRIMRIRRPGLYRALVILPDGAQVSGHSRAIRVG